MKQLVVEADATVAERAAAVAYLIGSLTHHVQELDAEQRAQLAGICAAFALQLGPRPHRLA